MPVGETHICQAPLHKDAGLPDDVQVKYNEMPPLTSNRVKSDPRHEDLQQVQDLWVTIKDVTVKTHRLILIT
jgi:hypothetical protein